MHRCNVLIHVLPTVYVHLINCLCEYSSKRTFRHHFVYFSIHETWKCCERHALCVSMLQCLRSENRTELSYLLHHQMYAYVCSSLTPTYWHYFTFYESCSIYFNLWPAGSHLTSYAADSFWINHFPNCPCLTFLSRFYSWVKMAIDLSHIFCQSKIVFVCYRLIVVSEKNVVDENDAEYYSSTKLTLV